MGETGDVLSVVYVAPRTHHRVDRQDAVISPVMSRYAYGKRCNHGTDAIFVLILSSVSDRGKKSLIVDRWNERKDVFSCAKLDVRRKELWLTESGPIATYERASSKLMFVVFVEVMKKRLDEFFG